MTPCVIRQHRTDFARGACSPALALLRRSPARGCGVVAAGAPASPPRLQPQPPGGKKRIPAPAWPWSGLKIGGWWGKFYALKKKGAWLRMTGKGRDPGCCSFCAPQKRGWDVFAGVMLVLVTSPLLGG